MYRKLTIEILSSWKSILLVLSILLSAYLYVNLNTVTYESYNDLKIDSYVDVLTEKEDLIIKRVQFIKLLKTNSQILSESCFNLRLDYSLHPFDNNYIQIHMLGSPENNHKQCFLEISKIYQKKKFEIIQAIIEDDRLYLESIKSIEGSNKMDFFAKKYWHIKNHYLLLEKDGTLSLKLLANPKPKISVSLMSIFLVVLVSIFTGTVINYLRGKLSSRLKIQFKN